MSTSTLISALVAFALGLLLGAVAAATPSTIAAVFAAIALLVFVLSVYRRPTNDLILVVAALVIGALLALVVPELRLGGDTAVLVVLAVLLAKAV